ncbi:ABC transporter ATP-binding protein [Propylenella binzhouense]|uniref:ABC transporter ATP-binding protein n=1 Tax=Propylenella binzhouense TaxID=2555902 RepID=A0A964WTA6_9HYPH|nr:ABC transporter ATP-binding protein [Propylenella binzhouense]MYZ47751.1 ABC transporter ATP-binding protein [Propylenella binzhouense]
MSVVSLANVSLEYPIFNSGSRSLQIHLYKALGGHIAVHDHKLVVEALRDVTLELEDGDRLGIVGHNGAGKTSLLRVLSGVYTPTSGSARVDGAVSSLTDITLGMDLEANGWDNIVFRSVFLGLTFREARRKAPEIGAFTELGDFLNLPIRTYSAGMFLRLAFAISTSVNADVIIMDEMIGAGDASFVEKAQKRIEELLGTTRVVVLASHNLAILSQIANKVLWLEKGCVRMLGPTQDVLGAYMASVAHA